MIENPIEKLEKILKGRLRLFAAKNADYGSSYAVDGLIGIIIRLGDKLMRMKKTTEKGYVVRVKDEGLKDLFTDIANYCDLGTMLLEESNEKNTDINH